LQLRLFFVLPENKAKIIILNYILSKQYLFLDKLLQFYEHLALQIAAI